MYVSGKNTEIKTATLRVAAKHLLLLFSGADVDQLTGAIRHGTLLDHFEQGLSDSFLLVHGLLHDGHADLIHHRAVLAAGGK